MIKPTTTRWQYGYIGILLSLLPLSAGTLAETGEVAPEFPPEKDGSLAPATSLGADEAATASPEEKDASLSTLSMSIIPGNDGVPGFIGATTVVGREALVQMDIREIAELSNRVPSFDVFPLFPGQDLYSLRGAHLGVTTPEDYEALSVFVNGVKLSYPSTLLFNPVEIERIEIIRGPQLIHGGYQAAGGAVNVVYRHADLNVRQFNSEISLGDSRSRISSYFSQPIRDNLAFSISGSAVSKSPSEGEVSLLTLDSGRLNGHFRFQIEYVQEGQHLEVGASISRNETIRGLNNQESAELALTSDPISDKQPVEDVLSRSNALAADTFTDFDSGQFINTGVALIINFYRKFTPRLSVDYAGSIQYGEHYWELDYQDLDQRSFMARIDSSRGFSTHSLRLLFDYLSWDTEFGVRYNQNETNSGEDAGNVDLTTDRFDQEYEIDTLALFIRPEYSHRSGFFFQSGGYYSVDDQSVGVALNADPDFFAPARLGRLERSSQSYQAGLGWRSAQHSVYGEYTYWLLDHTIGDTLLESPMRLDEAPQISSQYISLSYHGRYLNKLDFHLDFFWVDYDNFRYHRLNLLAPPDERVWPISGFFTVDSAFQVRNWGTELEMSYNPSEVVGMQLLASFNNSRALIVTDPGLMPLEEQLPYTPDQQYFLRIFGKASVTATHAIEWFLGYSWRDQVRESSDSSTPNSSAIGILDATVGWKYAQNIKLVLRVRNVLDVGGPRYLYSTELGAIEVLQPGQSALLSLEYTL